MFKSPSFKAFNRPNGHRRSQSNKNNDTTIITGDTPSTGEISTTVGTMPPRLMNPRTSTTSILKGKGETSSPSSTPNRRTNRGSTGYGDDYAEDTRLSCSNDSPVSFKGSATFYHTDSPSRLAANPNNNSAEPKNPSSTSVDSANHHSAVLDSSDVDVAAAIALLQELRKRASPEDLVALHKALLPSRTNEHIIPLSKSELRDNDEPLSPLIRRSSLLPAGIKTRLSRELLRNFSEPRVQDRSNSTGPSPSPDLNKPLNYEALDLANEAIEARAARAATPSDFVCPQIGTYKHGSLRITNGAASPEPGLLLNKVAAGYSLESGGNDGFFTADEGETSSEAPRQVQVNRPSLRENKSRGRNGTSDLRTRSKSRAPLRVETPRHSSDEDSAKCTPRQASRPRLPQRNSTTARERAVDAGSSKDFHSSSPIATASASRLSTVHDMSPVEGNKGDREHTLQKLNGETVQAQDGVKPSKGARYLGVARPSMHAKSDSGYSSEASRRPNSIVKESDVDEFLMAAIDAADRAELARAQGLTVTGPSSDKARQDNLHTAKVVDIRKAQRAEKHRSMPSFFSTSRKTASSTSVNTVATLPATLPAKQPKKLQKTRPQASRSMTVPIPKETESVKADQPAKEIQPVQESQADVVPNVSEDTLVNFSRRLNRTPGMAHLEHTFTSVDEVLQPKPEPTEEDNDRRGRGRSRKQDKKPDPVDAEASPGGSKRRSIFRFRSRSRSKSQHRQEEVTVLSVEDEPMPTFSDFGTVAQSLGCSPYDIATRRVKDIGAYDPSKPLFHPHEITHAAANGQTAGRLNNNRSHEHAPQDTKTRSRSLSRPRTADEPNSLQKPSASEGTVPRPPTRGKSRRSMSAHSIAVPLLPETPKENEPAAQVASSLFSADGVRVGTIDFGNGIAQGRLAPMLTTSEKAKVKRRTQSVSPRSRFCATSPMIPEEPVPQTPTPRSSKARASAEESISLPQIPALPTFRALPQLPDILPVDHTASRTEPSSPVHTPMRPVLPSWEAQARAWRERKQSIGEILSSPAPERKTPTAPKTPLSPVVAQSYSPSPMSPRVVVSRYITPVGSELATHLGVGDENDPYKALRGENPTDLRPAQEDVNRTDSSSTYRTAASGKSEDSFASKDSAKYLPYRPADAASSKRLSSPPPPKQRSGRPFDVQRRPLPASEDQGLLYDRFSGGLSYGWDRGTGFGGSAGTRAKHDTKASRKSVVLSENFGVDLSDVPVFFVKQ